VTNSVSENQLFDFWAGVAPDCRVHPEDEPILQTAKHHLKLCCIPNPYYGPLLTARVVLLFLNPGFLPKDEADAQSEQEMQFYWRQRQGNEPLRSQIDLAKKSWWVPRVKGFSDQDPEHLRDKMAILELCAYHSETFKDARLLRLLPSSQVALEWAQTVLFPQARSKQRVVICMRSHKRWGLERNTSDGWLFVPPVNRSGHLLKDFRQPIIDAVKKGLGQNPA